MQTTLESLKTSRYIGENRYLGGMDFGWMMLAAAGLHLAGLILWSIIPHDGPDTVPVRVLNVRFGAENGVMFEGAATAAQSGTGEAGGGLVMPSANPAPSPSVPSQQAPNASSAALDHMLSQLESGQPATKHRAAPARAVSEGGNMKSADDTSQAPVRYVRQWGGGQATGAGKGNGTPPARYGSPVGNSTAANAEMLRRYEQVISLWIAKFKVYPEEARSRGLQGEAVVRIKIDRQGRILQYRIEQSSGHAVIDSALGEMIRRANPIPAVPKDYPGGANLEFLVPVDFTLK